MLIQDICTLKKIDMKNIITTVIIVLSAVLFFSCEKDNASPGNKVEVIKANGNIQDDVDAFKNMLGPLNTTPDAIGGYREINWDGVPDSLLDKPLPNDFFNPTGNHAVAARQRGVAYAGGSFMVSSNGFAAINSEASSQFTAFSGTKTFANTTAAKWDVLFQKAGTADSASVLAFGLVFADVDGDNSTSVEFFNGDKSLGKYFVPAHNATSNFSFLAANINNNERITKVTVAHDGFLTEGTKDISDGGTRDLIVLDDFIYSEPVAE